MTTATSTHLGPIDDADMSTAERVALTSDEDRAALLLSMSDEQLEALRYDWSFWQRPDQATPDDQWLILALLGGRGSGKTRTGAEAVRQLASGKPSWGGFIAPTPKDARDIMIEGESGILAVSPKHERPEWEPSKNRLTWPNGSLATVFSAADPEAIRGPNLAWAWCEEMGKWRFMRRSWDNLRFAMRAGERPQTVITTTPIRAQLIKEIVGGGWEETVVRRVSTYRNAANLAPTFLRELLRKYEGTRLGMQELHGLILDAVEGALWTADLLQHWEPTDREVSFGRPMRRIVVGVDPSGRKTGADAGVVAAGQGMDGLFYVLDDLSARMSSNEWGAAATGLYRRLHADRIVGEANFGGDMVRAVVEGVDPGVSYKDVHASRGKMQRAEPIVSLYEQRRVIHVGHLGMLEEELTTWVPPGTLNEQGIDIGSNWSPGRLDALVWALTELSDGGPTTATATKPSGRSIETGVRTRQRAGLGR